MAPANACKRCIMNAEVDPDLRIDDAGVCRYCREYDALLANPEYALEHRAERLAEGVAEVKRRARGRKYDCVLGVSGGVDSSYAVWFTVRKLGLKPLVVHLDNGWNSELAVLNIERLVRGLGVDLYTHVIDWEEFRDLQRSMFKASVVDIELITDHAIIAVLFHIARRFRIPTVVTGDNFATEATLPKGWNHPKTDLVNILAIHRAFGTRRIPTFPKLGTPELFFHQKVLGIRWFRPFFYTSFDKKEAIATLQRDLGWRAYGGKHYESVFTRFYQGWFLPKKFGIDKRWFHYSRLVASGQMTRDAALDEIARPAMDPALAEQDRRFVLKKLGFSEAEWDAIMHDPPRSHGAYWSDEKLVHLLLAANRAVRSMRARVA
jgi:N-acetyl sugar amidotransferase